MPQLLGSQFRVVETKWADIQRLVGWYEEVFTLLPETDDHTVAFRDVLLKSRTERVRAVSAGMAVHQIAVRAFLEGLALDSS